MQPPASGWICTQAKRLLRGAASTGDQALSEGLLGTTLLAGFLAMLVLDVLHQAVSGDAAHSHDRASPTAHAATNGDLEQQRHAYGEQRPSAATRFNPLTALVVRHLPRSLAGSGLVPGVLVSCMHLLCCQQ